jgi:hypothetical protein
VNVNTVTDWTAGLITGLTAGMARFFGAIPNILGALILLIIGWIIAGIVGGLVTKLCRGIHVDTVADRVGVDGFLQQSGTKLRTSNIIGEIIIIEERYWCFRCRSPLLNHQDRIQMSRRQRAGRLVTASSM